MAASEERAARIRELKESRPDLTWDRIAQYVDVKERSAVEWQKTGGITYENCAKLAELFGVDAEVLWSGRERPGGSGDLMSNFATSATQLDRIEAKLDEILSLLRPSESPGDVAETAAGRIEATPPAAVPTRKPPRRSKPAA